MTWLSDGPKTCWGYYQDYLVQIYGKKNGKKIPSIFSKNHKGIKKMAETEVAPDFQIGPETEWTRPVEYVDVNMA